MKLHLIYEAPSAYVCRCSVSMLCIVVQVLMYVHVQLQVLMYVAVQV